MAIDQLTPEENPDQVYIGNADGTDLELIAAGVPLECIQHWEPAWSPDGKSLAIATGGGGITEDGPNEFGISVIDVATESVREVINHPRTTGQDHFPRWSPGGDRLVFWRERPGAGSEIETAVFVVDVAGGAEEQRPSGIRTPAIRSARPTARSCSPPIRC